VERNKANESFPIPGLRRHALLCFAFEATKQQASAKKKKNPGGGSSSNVNKAKDSGPGQIGAVLFDGTRDTRRHCTGLEIYY
jgi:hypothetical protein